MKLFCGNCVNQKMLYQTDRKGYKNCVFLSRDGNGNAKYACVRGCTGDFRGDVSGSQKRFGFCIPALDPDATRVETYDAPIDALSGASLRTMRQREWRTVHYLSLGGLNYHALEQFWLTIRKCASSSFALTQMDLAELLRPSRTKRVEKYTAQGYAVDDLIPPKGKDVNDYLRIRLGLKKEHERQRRMQWLQLRLQIRTAAQARSRPP